MHFYTTNEMLDAFKFLGEDKAKKIVKKFGGEIINVYKESIDALKMYYIWFY